MTSIPARMTAIVITAPGGPEVCAAAGTSRSRAGNGEILIKVDAAGVNRPDIMQRLGFYPPPAGVTDIPGLEMAGEVVACGAEVSRWKEGDHVTALVAGGGYARVLRRARKPRAADPVRPVDGAGGRGSGNVLYGVAQRFRARPAQGRRDAAGARRQLRHRHRRDPARQGARRPRHRDRGQRREMRSLPAPRAPMSPSTTGAKISSPSPRAAPAAPAPT